MLLSALFSAPRTPFSVLAVTISGLVSPPESSPLCIVETAATACSALVACLEDLLGPLFSRGDAGSRFELQANLFSRQHSKARAAHSRSTDSRHAVFISREEIVGDGKASFEPEAVVRTLVSCGALKALSAIPQNANSAMLACRRRKHASLELGALTTDAWCSLLCSSLHALLLVVKHSPSSQVHICWIILFLFPPPPLTVLPGSECG